MNLRNSSLRNQRRTIGQFQYFQNKIIGKGTYSVAYQGNHIITKEKVCVKQILVKDNRSEKMIINEIDVLQKFQTENIVKYISHFRQGSFYYIITELCDQNLLAKISKNGKLSEQEALGIFQQILKGYKQFRQQGYIHRDIKPENILLKAGQIKIGDLGFCIKLPGELIIERFNLGSPLYMSPQSLNKNTYSQFSQIWSLGILLHEMIIGKTPFKSKKEEQLKRQMLIPLKINNCSPNITKIIQNCLAYSPRSRYNFTKLYDEVAFYKNQLSQQKQEQNKELKRVKMTKIIQNQLNYIQFLEYVKQLVKEANQNQIEQRLTFLLQYSIRMRILIINSIFIANKQNIVSQFLKQKYQKLIINHQFQLFAPANLSKNDRLLFFDCQNIQFKESLQWQTQAELKEAITKRYNTLCSIHSQQQIVRCQKRLKTIDFLTTFFILNKILIQMDNNIEKYSVVSNLHLILNSPTRFNIKVYKNLQKKLKQLKFI